MLAILMGSHCEGHPIGILIYTSHITNGIKHLSLPILKIHYLSSY